MSLKDDKQQNIQMELDFSSALTGAARGGAGEETESLMATSEPENPARTNRLMEEVCERENLKEALRQVKGNKGSAGIDGVTVDQLTDYLKQHWPTIREQLLNGTYEPKPVRRVEIPKPDGGVRKLGIPTVLDRFIQQAAMQVLQRRWDRTFSEHSYGFRPGRSAHQAVAQAQQYIAADYSCGAIVPLVVTIPAPAADDTSAPTGLVVNLSGDFVVTKNGKSGASIFIFDTEDGTIVGWSPGVDLTNGVIAVPNTHGAIYKGLAIAKTSKGTFLYASDFHNGVVEIYNAHFQLQKSFTDTSLPDGYAPFGIQNINGQIFVTFAKQDELKEDEIAGPGLGFVDIFDTDGNLVRRFASRGPLNAPWGLAMAPATFGKFANALLVGNFGDGRISAFEPTSGKFLGRLRNTKGEILSIDGLWAITQGGGAGTTPDEILFTAGPNDEANGLFGKLNPRP